MGERLNYSHGVLLQLSARGYLPTASTREPLAAASFAKVALQQVAPLQLAKPGDHSR